MASRSYSPPEKSIAQVLSEFKDELKEFAATRFDMLRGEMRGKLGVLRMAVPAIVAGAVLAGFAVIFFSIALVAFFAFLLGGGIGAWAGAFAIVALLFLLIGGFAIGAAISKLKARSLLPERTLRVLRNDQIWLQQQARNRQ